MQIEIKTTMIKKKSEGTKNAKKAGKKTAPLTIAHKLAACFQRNLCDTTANTRCHCIFTLFTVLSTKNI